MKKFIILLLTVLISAVLIVSLLACGCSKEDYGEYPEIYLSKQFEFNGNIYYSLSSPYWNNSESDDYYSLWDIDSSQFNEIVGKEKAGYGKWAPIYKHDILKEDCLMSRIGQNKYLKDGYVFLSEKNLLLEGIKTKAIIGRDYLKGNSLYSINENIKESVFENVTTINDIINQNATISRDVFAINKSEFSNIYCILGVNIYFKDLEYFYLNTDFYVYENKVLVLLNDYIYEVKSEYATQIYNYVSEK